VKITLKIGVNAALKIGVNFTLIYTHVRLLLFQFRFHAHAVNSDITKEAASMETNQGCLLCTGSLQQIEEVFIVLEKKILFEVKVTESVVALFSVFYVFNINFPANTYSFFQF